MLHKPSRIITAGGGGISLIIPYYYFTYFNGKVDTLFEEMSRPPQKAGDFRANRRV